MRINKIEQKILGLIVLSMVGWSIIGLSLFHMFWPEIAPKISLYTIYLIVFLFFGTVLYFLIKWGFSILIDVEPKKNQKKNHKK